MLICNDRGRVLHPGASPLELDPPYFIHTSIMAPPILPQVHTPSVHGPPAPIHLTAGASSWHLRPLNHRSLTMANSIFSALSDTIIGTLETVTDVASATQKTVSMATTYVDNRAKRQTKTDREYTILETAKEMKLYKNELDADAELKSIFDALEADW